jgi:hypothetical protein
MGSGNVADWRPLAAILNAQEFGLCSAPGAPPVGRIFFDKRLDIMERFCVFCGKKPQDENKEHVIPQWLMELTGDKTREFYFGPDYSKNKPGYRSFSAQGFKFPSCSKCNDKYSTLEAKVKNTITNIIVDDIIRNDELNDLFDWFDKVRIGLWLAYIYLDKNLHDIEPNYFIENRIGKSDRSLLIYKTDLHEKCLNFYGIQSPAFQYMPSCFSLIINNYTFLNISTDYIISRRVGFPYPDKIMIGPEKGTIGFNEIYGGLNRFYKPIMNRRLSNPQVSIHQAIYIKTIEDEAYKQEYVLLHQLSLGKSEFVIETNEICEWAKEEYNIKQEKHFSDFQSFMNWVGEMVRKLQIDLIKELSFDECTDSQKEGYKKCLNEIKRLQAITLRNERISYAMMLRDVKKSK